MKSSAFDTSGLDLTPLQDKYSGRERLLHFRGCNAFFSSAARQNLKAPNAPHCLKLQVAGCSYKLPVGFGVKAVIYNSGIVLNSLITCAHSYDKDFGDEKHLVSDNSNSIAKCSTDCNNTLVYFFKTTGMFLHMESNFLLRMTEEKFNFFKRCVNA